MADRPSSRTAACAARPRTSPEKVSAPAWAHTTSKPVGSGIRQASKAESRSSAANVPCPPSSSEATAQSTTSQRADPRAAAMACSAATTAPFMSTDPRPCTKPSSIAPDQGPCRHGSEPGATTSTWPLRHSRGAPAGPGSVTVRPSSSERSASSPGWPGSDRSAARSCSCSSASSPMPAAISPTSSSAARSWPVTLGTRTSAATSRARACVMAQVSSGLDLRGSSDATPPEIANTRTSDSVHAPRGRIEPEAGLSPTREPADRPSRCRAAAAWVRRRSGTGSRRRPRASRPAAACAPVDRPSAHPEGRRTRL